SRPFRRRRRGAEGCDGPPPPRRAQRRRGPRGARQHRRSVALRRRAERRDRGPVEEAALMRPAREHAGEPRLQIGVLAVDADLVVRTWDAWMAENTGVSADEA